MLAHLLVATLVSAAPPGTPIKLAAPALSGPNLTPAESEFYVEHLAQQLVGRGLQVTTAKQISTLLGMERQKALVGCGDQATSCISELGNALGVDGLLTGEIGKLEGAFQVNLKVISPVSGQQLTAYTARVSNEAALVDELTYAAQRIAGALAATFHRTLPAPSAMVVSAEETASRPLRGGAWIPAAVGVTALGAGAFLYLQANERYTTLATSTAPINAVDARGLRDSGSLLQTLSLAGAGLGAAALVTAGTMFFFHRDPAEQPPPAQVGVVPLPGGAAFAVSGVLP